MTGLTLLQGLRVVSLEQFIAGPYCTSMLADAGAEVTKIERPGVGDPRRAYDPRIGSGDEAISGGFASYNRGKRSVELALNTEDGVAELERMLAEADVLVCNLRPGSLTRMGLAPATLRERYPRLVICEITGFGSTGGEAADWPAFDSVIQGMSGLASLVGEADGPPTLTSTSPPPSSSGRSPCTSSRERFRGAGSIASAPWGCSARAMAAGCRS
jgi:CoA:oxalate CoA-transferase